jgi:hypothetical protein
MKSVTLSKGYKPTQSGWRILEIHQPNILGEPLGVFLILELQFYVIQEAEPFLLMNIVWQVHEKKGAVHSIISFLFLPGRPVVWARVALSQQQLPPQKHPTAC